MTRYSSGSILTTRGKDVTYIDGVIDMGYGTGVNIGIYRNVYVDRPRIIHGKRSLRKVRPKGI